jgi:hypothetical protein
VATPFSQAVVFSKPILQRDRERAEIAVEPRRIDRFQIRAQLVCGRQLGPHNGERIHALILGRTSGVGNGGQAPIDRGLAGKRLLRSFVHDFIDSRGYLWYVGLQC